ncbi:his operon leader peptide [Salmonella enterica subsp. enterica]|nr:his operon leader peptide [Salmonella enterica subsp. enterica]
MSFATRVQFKYHYHHHHPDQSFQAMC